MTKILIVGMMRSGTTICTRIIAGAGFALRTPKMKGNQEDRNMVNANMQALVYNGLDWHDPEKLLRLQSMYISGEHPEIPQQSITLAQRVRVDRQGLSDVVIKDPKSSLLLPFWMEQLPDYKIIWCIRHPHEVVESHYGMAQRGLRENHQQLMTSYASYTSEDFKAKWLIYNDIIERQLVGNITHRWMMVNHADWSTMPYTTCEKVSKFVEADVKGSYERHFRHSEIKSSVAESRSDELTRAYEVYLRKHNSTTNIL